MGLARSRLFENVRFWVISGHTDKSGAVSALPPITHVGRRIQVSIWLSVYEYTPQALRRQ